MTREPFFRLVTENEINIYFALLGGLILGVFKLIEHYLRKPTDKYPWYVYIIYILICIIGFPFLGIFFILAYLSNGDKFSLLSSAQIGLTSPAILISMIAAGANSVSKKGVIIKNENQ